MPLTYRIITPERILEEGQADSISVMTTTGEITILPNHIPLATMLAPGELRVMKSGKEELFAVSTGLFEVLSGNVVQVLADTAERSDELEIAALEAAKKRAEDALLDARNKDAVSYADAAAHMERELARYRVALKGKGRQGRASAPVSE